jgi:hypothetical protein
MINFNKGISTPIALTIIIVLAVVSAGGIFAYQYYLSGQEAEIPKVETPETEKSGFSVLDRDALLHKLFPKLTFANGVANHEAGHYEYLNLYLESSVEDYFTNIQNKDILFIAQLDGVAHVGGLYHAFLGLFDENGNLLTPTSSYPNLSIEDETQFGGDQGDFGFYNCNGVKYIAFASAGCPNGTCCFGRVNLFRINNGEFEKIQTIDDESLASNSLNPQSIVFSSVEAAAGPSYGLKMILSDEKIIVKKVPSISDNGCLETDYKELKWNKNSCRFE